MKILNSIALLLCVLCIPVDAAENPLLKITGSVSETVSIDHCIHSDALKRYALHDVWNPESDSLPLNITDGLKRAKSHLQMTRGITNELAFHGVSIHDVDIPFKNDDGVKSYAKIWYATFQFSGKTQSGKNVPWNELVVVMLLDYTIADVVVLNGKLTAPIIGNK